jgi:predicted NUDIX family phosphoesterase
VTTDVELVLGLPRDRALRDEGWRGIRASGVDELLERVRAEGTYRPRPEAEIDPSWKQVIPYLVLRDGERIFLMQRTRAGGDDRLHERYTIGIGGHVNPADGDVDGGLRREWQEEMVADFMPEVRPLGVLNDDSDPVGSVHLGLVFVADAAGRRVSIRESHKLRGGFATVDEVAAVRGRLEGWSALVFDLLVADEERSEP